MIRDKRDRRPSSNPMLEVLFASRTRAKLLTMFLTHPGDDYYVRELARRAGFSLRAIQHELVRLERLGLVQSRTRGRAKFYRANEEHPLYRDLKSMVDKVAGETAIGNVPGRLNAAILRRDPVLAEITRRLIEAYEPDRVYLFGSKSRDEENPDSDYDLLVVVPDSAPPERRRSRLAYERLWGTGAAADVLVWTRSDFDSRLHLKASLPSTIVREGKLLHVA